MTTHKKASKVQFDKTGSCMCGAEFDGRNCEAEAKRHAIETGHIPTLTFTYDIIPEGE